MNIKEDYVSFEIAKLLKEKGFKGQRENFYENNKIISYINYWDRITPKQRYEAIEAPTLQMTMKWLREVHNIHIVVHPYTDMEGNNWSFVFDKFAYGCWQELGIYITDSWNTYEEACEAAIKYCLENLI